MEFCDICENMLYVKMNERSKMIFFCKNCGFNKELKDDVKSKLITETNYEEKTTGYSEYINKNIVHDPTLPRINNIEIGNAKQNKDSKRTGETIYIKYDNKNLKFLYYNIDSEEFFVE